MSVPMRFVAVMAIVAIAGLAAVTLLGSSGGVGGFASPTPTATPEDWSTLPPGVNATPLLWLRADAISGAAGSRVASWHADVGPAAVQSDLALQPTLGALGQRAAVLFDGQNDMLEAGLDINPSAHPQLTIVAVFSSDTNTHTQLRKLYGADDGDFDRTAGLDDRALNGDNYTVFAGPDPGVPVGYFDLKKATPYLTVDQFGAGTFNGWVNGRHALRNFGTTNGDGLSTFFIGGTGTVFHEPWEGTIAEMLVFDGTLSDSQRQALEDFLGRKYALTITRS